jgi:HemY protein
LKIDPGLTPAAATAAFLLTHGGRQRKAARIIETAWRLAPHPDLAEAYLGLRPNLSQAERLKQVAKLAALLPEHEESAVALGQAYLAAREFAKARAALAPLANGRPTARVCVLMAEIEEAENGMTGLAREWLARAAHAPRDPAWIADGVISSQWAPVAPESGRVGGFVWEHPPELLGAAPGSASLPARVEAPPAPARLQPAIMAAPALPAGSAAGIVKPDGAKEPSVPVAAPPAIEVPRLAAPGAGDGALASERPAAAATPADLGAVVAQSPTGGTIEANATPAKIAAVAFPLDRPPDDPGAEKPEGKGLWKRLTG